VYITHDSTVIRSVASYGIQYMAATCHASDKMYYSVSDIVSSSVSVDNIVQRQYVQSLASVQKSSTECLREWEREGFLILKDDLSSVVGDIILFICTQ